MLLTTTLFKLVRGQDSPLLAPGVWGPAAYDFESVYPGSGLLAFNVAPAFEPSLQTVYMSSVVVETKAEPLVTYSQAPGSEASASQAVFAEEASGSSAIADKLTEPYGVGSGTGGGWVIGQFSNDATASLPGTTEFRAVLTSALAAISPATAPLVWSYVSSAFESIPKSNTPLNRRERSRPGQFNQRPVGEYSGTSGKSKDGRGNQFCDRLVQYRPSRHFNAVKQLLYDVCLESRPGFG